MGLFWLRLLLAYWLLLVSFDEGCFGCLLVIVWFYSISGRMRSGFCLVHFGGSVGVVFCFDIVDSVVWS